MYRERDIHMPLLRSLSSSAVRKYSFSTPRLDGRDFEARISKPGEIRPRSPLNLDDVSIMTKSVLAFPSILTTCLPQPRCSWVWIRISMLKELTRPILRLASLDLCRMYQNQQLVRKTV